MSTLRGKGFTRSRLNVFVHGGKEYFELLANRISHAARDDRVLVTTMSFTPDEPLAKRVLEELYAASSRKAQVTLGVDAFALMECCSIGPLMVPWVIQRDAYYRRIAALEKLTRFGGRYGITNRPERLIGNNLAGRSHLKVGIIGDWVSLGGANLKLCDRIDVAVSFEDANTADWLYGLMVQMVELGSTSVFGRKDLSRQVDDDTDILIDVGVRRQSLIMERAVEIVQFAKERVTVSTPFIPYGPIGDAAARAIGAKIDTEVVFDAPNKGDRNNWVKYLAHAWRLRIYPEAFFYNVIGSELPIMHAKIIASESEAMVGSHNYIPVGVNLGTAEIAFVRRTAVFASNVHDLLWRQLDEAKAAA